jgi:hypothetical protein
MDILINPRIIITKYAIQRRKHQKPIDKDILVNLVKQIDDKFSISKKENNKYKIGLRNIVAIIRKTDEALILITAYCFEKCDYKIDNINLKVSIAVSKEDRKLNRDINRGMIHKIFRINFLNEKVECGIICAVKKSKYAKDKKTKG